MDLLSPHQIEPFSFDTFSYKEKIGRLCEMVKGRFQKILRRYALFHIISLTLLTGQALSLACLFPFWMESQLTAYSLGLFFLSTFSYLALKLYLQGKKPDQFEALRDLYLQSCKGLIHYQEGIAEHHLALAGAACKLSSALSSHRSLTYPPVRFSKRPLPLWERISFLSFCRDRLAMRASLLNCAIDEHIKLVRCEPTHLEVHAALANAYVMLSTLYIDPKKSDESTLPARWYGERERYAYRQAAKAAIEEFRILESFAPDDPWVYTQLAYCYHDLQMIDDEIHSYERILEMRPDDLESLFKLGMRYFEKGECAKGLKVYQELKEKHYPQAEGLLSFYSSAVSRNSLSLGRADFEGERRLEDAANHV